MRVLILGASGIVGRIVRWLGLTTGPAFVPGLIEVCHWWNSADYVKSEGCRVGTIVYTNYPIEGLFRTVGYENETNVSCTVIGELLIATDFGYPDPRCTGMILANILNKEAAFQRGVDGRWELGNPEVAVDRNGSPIA
jgi:hypothetical protein